jgi:hypothetical protein
VDAPLDKVVKGPPVKCVLCAGALVLNGAVLRTHLASKKHAKNAAAVEAGGHGDAAVHEIFCFAEDYASGSEEEGETWQERMDRLDAVVKEANAKVDAAAAAAAAKKAKRRQREAAKRKGGEHERKRPGKRQRQALRETGEGKPPKQRKARKGEATGEPEAREPTAKPAANPGGKAAAKAAKGKPAAKPAAAKPPAKAAKPGGKARGVKRAAM